MRLIARRLLRGLVWRVAPRVTPLIGVQCDRVRYVVSTADQSAGAMAFSARGPLEGALLRALGRALSDHTSITLEASTVLELGANIGTETVWMLVHHGVAHVVAIEPDPESLALLRANIALNGLEERTTVLGLAASDRDGPVEFERTPSFPGDNRIRTADSGTPLRLGEDRRHTISVRARSIDSLVKDGMIDAGAVDLMWIDVQGHEAHALAGAKSLADVPVLTEFWPYGLRRSGGLERFEEIVASRYLRVVDLGADGTVHPPAAMAALASHYEERPVPHPFGAFTNLLLVPHPA